MCLGLHWVPLGSLLASVDEESPGRERTPSTCWRGKKNQYSFTNTRQEVEHEITVRKYLHEIKSMHHGQSLDRMTFKVHVCTSQATHGSFREAFKQENLLKDI